MPIVIFVLLTIALLVLLLRAQVVLTEAKHVAFIQPVSTVMTVMLSTLFYVAGFAGLVMFVSQMLDAMLAVVIVV